MLRFAAALTVSADQKHQQIKRWQLHRPAVRDPFARFCTWNHLAGRVEGLFFSLILAREPDSSREQVEEAHLPCCSAATTNACSLRDIVLPRLRKHSIRSHALPVCNFWPRVSLPHTRAQIQILHSEALRAHFPTWQRRVRRA